jgi:hypothetical protein
MHVEDSYEGALRRLRRLEDAGFQQTPPSVLAQRDDADARMRDLEELASLACDENERLTRELAEVRAESERLRAQVATLQMMLAGATPDDELALPRKRRGAAFYFFLLTLVGAAAAAAFVLRPWERLMPPAHVIVPEPAPPAPPVVTPPPVVTAPTVTPPATPPVAAAAVPATKPTTAPAVTAPKPATTSIPSVNAIPKAAVAPAVEKTHGRHHHAAKHHASKRAHHPASSAAKKQAIGDTDDPLGGTSL